MPHVAKTFRAVPRRRFARLSPSLALGLALGLGLLGPALLASPVMAAGAAEEQGGATEPGQPLPQMLEDTGRRLFQVLELLMQAIPSYEMPEVLENGDIIIRRKPTPPAESTVPPGQDRT